MSVALTIHTWARIFKMPRQAKRISTFTRSENSGSEDPGGTASGASFCLQKQVGMAIVLFDRNMAKVAFYAVLFLNHSRVLHLMFSDTKTCSLRFPSQSPHSDHLRNTNGKKLKVIWELLCLWCHNRAEWWIKTKPKSYCNLNAIKLNKFACLFTYNWLF